MNPLEIMGQPSLMAFWREHGAECRPVGQIAAAARAGNLRGVAELENGHGHRVVNEQLALAAMRKV